MVPEPEVFEFIETYRESGNLEMFQASEAFSGLNAQPVVLNNSQVEEVQVEEVVADSGPSKTTCATG